MITYMSLQDTSIKSLKSMDIQSAMNLQARFFEYWQKYGVLVISRPSNGRSYFFEQIDSLPQRLRKRWKTASGHLRLKRIDNQTPKIHECRNDKHLSIYEIDIDLYLIGSDGSLDFGISSQDTSIILNNSKLEVCQFDYFDSSKASDSVKEFWDTDVKARTPVHKILETRFGSLILFANNVVVVDRYALSDHCDKMDNNKISGLQNFIEFLCKTNSSINLTIIVSEQPSKYDINLMVNRFNNLITANAFTGVKLIIVNKKVFQLNAHLRYVRIGRTVIEIDTGLDLFSGSLSWRNVSVSLRMCGKSRQSDVETELLKFPLRVEIY